MLNLARLCFVVIAISASFLAAAEPDIWKNPAKASDIKSIDSAFAPMTAHAVIRGDFKQTKTIPQLKKEFVSNGKFVIANEKGILWNTEKPFASKLSISNTKMVQQNTNGTKSEIKASDNVIFAQISATIQAVFSGNTDKLQKEFKIFFVKNGKDWKIGLIPLEKNVQKAIASIELTGSTWLNTVKLIDGSNSPLLYELTHPKTDSNLTPEEKAFFAE